MSTRKLYTNPIFPDGKEPVVWKRPCEMHDEPKFIHEGVSRFDLHQGALGNCCFIAAAATLATRPELFKRVVPSGQRFVPGYDGKFRFNFWRFGTWIEVVIDDRLPTREGKLVYCGNKITTNEFWPALLEKAYATFVGSYEAMDGGYPQDALVDFTGGIGQRIDLTETKPLEFYKFILSQNNMNTLMSCCFHKAGGVKEALLSNGLVAGHAYSIISIKSVITEDGEQRLLRLRNPWGTQEWNGAWSDNDEKMSAGMRRELGLEIRDDGEFWMSYEDWLTNFQELSLCHLPPDVKLEGHREWEELAFHGSWETEGSFSFVLSGCQRGRRTEKTNTVIVSLMQMCAPHDRVHMTVELHEVPQPQNLSPIKQLVGEDRELSDAINLRDGTYVVSGSTREPYANRTYLLRIYTDGCIERSY